MEYTRAANHTNAGAGFSLSHRMGEGGVRALSICMVYLPFAEGGPSALHLCSILRSHQYVNVIEQRKSALMDRGTIAGHRAVSCLNWPMTAK